MSEEDDALRKAELRETIVRDFTDILTVDEREAAVTMSLYKLRKACMALQEIEVAWLDHRLTTEEGLITLDVLLGGIGGIRVEVKSML